MLLCRVVATLALLAATAGAKAPMPRLELPEGFVATTTAPETGGQVTTFVRASHSNGMQIAGGIDETSPFSSERVPGWVEYFKTNAPKTMPLVVDGTRLTRESGTAIGVVLFHTRDGAYAGAFIFRPYRGVEMVVSLQGPIAMDPTASVKILETLVAAVGRIPEPAAAR